MAYLRKRKSGKWQVIIRKKNYPYVVRSFLEKSTASKFAKDVETQMDKQIFQDLTGASTTTLKELMIKYRDEIVPSQKACRQTTATLNMLMKHRIAFYSLTQLKSAHLYKLKKEMLVGRAPKTVNGYIQLLSLIWKTAKKVWSISLPAESPFELVTLDKVNNQRDVIISKEEEKKLIAEAAKSKMNNLADMIKFAILVGARWSEIVALERKNVCFNKKTATFIDTKNGTDHTIPLHDDAIAILKKYPFGDKFFQVSSYGKFEFYFDQARKRAGLTHIKFHDTRATFCTRALLSGMSIPEVAALSNHQDWASLKRYSRIKPTDLLEKINNVVNLK
jgi:integrase